MDYLCGIFCVHSRSGVACVSGFYDGSRPRPHGSTVDTREKILLFRRIEKVQPSRISAYVTCETRASQGDHPLDRPRVILRAATNAVVADFGGSPCPSSQTTPTETTFDVLPRSSSRHLVSSAGLLRRSPGPRRKILAVIAPALPNRSRMVAARVSTSRVPADPAAGRRVRTLEHYHIPI